MTGTLIVIGCLCVMIAVVWWRGRHERERMAALARAVEASRKAQADAAARDAVVAARRRADGDLRRPALDVLNEKMRRGGKLPIVFLTLALAAPARALDCSTLPPITALTPDQAECLRLDAVATELRAEVCEAQLVAARVAAEACEATASITCPPPEVPVIPFLAGVATGVVLAIVGGVLLFAGLR